MTSRRWRKLAILAKIEATYGSDAAPTAPNAIIATNVNFTPIEGDEVSRDLILPYLNGQSESKPEDPFELLGAQLGL